MASKRPKLKREIMEIFWKTEVIHEPDGAVTLKAILPLFHMSRRQAAKALGCSESTITDLYRLGLLKGFKPGARTIERVDGKGSNAALRLFCDSVLEYKKRQEKASIDWQESR